MPPDYLYFEFLDVGMGECTFIKYKNEKILIDLGSTKSRAVAVPDAITYLKSQLTGTDPTLDLVVFTHPDQDHYNQFSKLVEAVPSLEVNTIWYGGQRSDYTVGNFSKYLKDEGASPIPNNYYSKDPNWKSDDGTLKIYMIACNHPTRDANDPNPRSIVLVFTWQHFKILMTGDATDATETQILQRFKGESLLRIDVTKVPHHGSETSSSLAFVKETAPSIIIVSADNNPTYKLPRKSILSRYDRLDKSADHTYVEYDDSMGVQDFKTYSTKKDLYTTLEGLLQGVQWELRFASNGTIDINKT